MFFSSMNVIIDLIASTNALKFRGHLLASIIRRVYTWKSVRRWHSRTKQMHIAIRCTISSETTKPSHQEITSV